MSAAADPGLLLAAADRRQIEGDISGAIEAYDLLLTGTPDFWPAHANRGLALAVAGKDGAARHAFRCALSIAPAAWSPLRNLLDSLLLTSSVDTRLFVMANALRAIAPERFESWLGLGRVMLRRAKSADARRAFEHSIILAPAESDAILALGEVSVLADRLRWFKRLVNVLQSPTTLLALACSENASGERGNARLHIRRALALDPSQADSLIELTGVIDNFAATEELASWGRRAVTRTANSAAAWNNLGAAELGLGNLAQAEKAFANAISIVPDFAEAHFNRATPLFLADRPDEAWSEYEWRWRVERFGRPPSIAPRWAGEPLRGRTLLVHDEQGLGDTLQFVRYVPKITSDGGNIVVACDPRLVSLFQGSLDGVSVVPRSAIPAHDLAVPLLSLPYLLGGAGNPPPYLSADHSATIDAGGRRRVGLVWSGNPEHPRDLERSVPLGRFRELLRHPNIAWISLQVGQARADIERAGVERDLPDLGGRVSNLLDTARIMATLDLLITVDTAAAHLAGAMNLPVWMLASWLPDWRWGIRGPLTHWYPSMRLFRQSTRGNWTAVIDDISAALSSEVSLA